MSSRKPERNGPAPAGAPYGIAPPGHRLPEATRLGSVKLQVASLERSLRFYNRVLGLRTLQSESDRATLGAPQDTTPLVELFERPGAAPAPQRGRLGLYHFALLTPDRATLGRFIRHAGELDVRLGMADHHVSEALYLSDPDGLGIEVYADRPRSAWQRTGRQLVMVTEPLNVADLLSHAGDRPFGAMPPGTVVGHVHLHVGDLGGAEAFYHGALGFDKVVWSYPGALFLSAGGYHHHVGVNTWAAGARPAGPDDARLIAWTIVLPERADADRAAAGIDKAGYEVNGESGRWRAADPWGTTVELTAAPSG